MVWPEGRCEMSGWATIPAGGGNTLPAYPDEVDSYTVHRTLAEAVAELAGDPLAAAGERAFAYRLGADRTVADIAGDPDPYPDRVLTVGARGGVRVELA